jgi:hypothetical protein
MTKVTPVTSVFHRMTWDRPEEDEKFQRMDRASKKSGEKESGCLEKLREESSYCSIALSINNDLEEIIYWYGA